MIKENYEKATEILQQKKVFENKLKLIEEIEPRDNDEEFNTLIPLATLGLNAHIKRLEAEFKAL